MASILSQLKRSWGVAVIGATPITTQDTHKKKEKTLNLIGKLAQQQHIDLSLSISTQTRLFLLVWYDRRPGFWGKQTRPRRFLSFSLSLSLYCLCYCCTEFFFVFVLVGGWVDLTACRACAKAFSWPRQHQQFILTSFENEQSPKYWQVV
jgi:hypothetical protein